MKVGLRVAVAATVAATVLLVGCSPGNKNDSTSNPGTSASASNEDASALVKQSADAMKEVTGFHLILTAEGKVPNLKVTKVEGDVSNQPAPVATGTATINMGQDNPPAEAKIVYVDEHLYSDVAEPGKFTDYGNGSSIYNPTVLLDPGKGLSTLLTNLKDPKVEGTENVDGVDTTKVSAQSSTKDILVLAGSKMAPEKSTPLPVTLWIDNATHRIIKAELTAAENATVTLNLSDFNKQVTATKPV